MSTRCNPNASNVMPKEILQPGLQFEHTVAKLYEALGYDVKHNEKLHGQQIDIIATKTIPGIGRKSIAIECKYLSRKAVSNQDVFDFIAVIRALSNAPMEQRIMEGVLITNTRFSPEAKQAAQSSSCVRLFSFDELSEEVFCSGALCEGYCHEYETADIFGSYIPLSAADPMSKSNLKNIEEYLYSYCSEYKTGLITIIADYGAGKTTLLERVRYRLAKEIVSGQGKRFPILFRLKEYKEAGALDMFIKRTLIRELNTDYPIHVFWSALRAGRFAILLDGFDEMVAENTQERRIHALSNLTSLMLSECPVIITCRPTFFLSFEDFNGTMSALWDTASKRSDYRQPINVKAGKRTSNTARRLAGLAKSREKTTQEMANVLFATLYSKCINTRGAPTLLAPETLQTLYLEPLDATQIEGFLVQKQPAFELRGLNWKSVRDFLYKVYDLSDLMRKPLLLSMIIETVLAGGIDIYDDTIAVGPALLYEIYTTLRLKWDDEKGDRGVLSLEERRQCAVSIAVAMFDSCTLEVKSGLLDSIVDSSNTARLSTGFRNEERREVILSDIRLCTFLNFNSSGALQFSHKSFMEFFVARYLQLDASKREAADRRWLKPLPRAILYFLSSFIQGDPDLREKILLLLTQDKKPTNREGWRRNLASAIFFTTGQPPPTNIFGAEVSDIDIKDATFTLSKLNELRFVRVNALNLTFKNSELENVKVIDCENIVNPAFEQCNIKCELLRTTVRGGVWRGSSSHISGTDFKLDKGVLSGGEMKITSPGHISDLRVSEGKLLFMNMSREQGRVENLVADSMEIVVSGFQCESWSLRDSDLEVRESGHLLRLQQTNGSFTSFGSGRVENSSLRDVKVKMKDGVLHATEFYSTVAEMESLHGTNFTQERGSLKVTGRLLLDNFSAKSSHMKFVGSQSVGRLIRNGSFRDCEVEVKDVSMDEITAFSSVIQIDGRFDGGGLNLDQCRWEFLGDITIGGTPNPPPSENERKPSRVSNSSILVGREDKGVGVSIRSAQFRHTKVEIYVGPKVGGHTRKAVIDGVLFEGGTLFLRSDKSVDTGQDEALIVLRNVTCKDVGTRIYGKASFGSVTFERGSVVINEDSIIDWGSASFIKSVVVGVTLVHGGIDSRFKGCEGLMIDDSPAETTVEADSRKMCNFKDGVLIVERKALSEPAIVQDLLTQCEAFSSALSENALSLVRDWLLNLANGPKRRRR